MRHVRSGERTSGHPTSSNRASSFHLRWDAERDAVAASVTLEVLTPPAVPELYFWALQVDLAGPAGAAGGAHLGLQWYPPHPGSTAVNWGGYRHGGGELEGSGSALASATGNPNTRDFRWAPHRRYRLTVRRSDGPTGPSGVPWRGEVTDVDAGITTVIRDLYAPGDRIAGVVMWSEVFARCDAPAVAVRWSAPTVLDPSGVTQQVQRLSVNYQSVADGGCSNTDSSPEGVGVVQRTSSPRATPQGAVIPVGVG